MTPDTPLATRALESQRVTKGAIQVLTIGWRLSFTLIIVGLVVAVTRDEPLASRLGSISQVLDQLVNGHSNGFLGIGILAMILSPIVAAGTIAISFFRIGDRRFGLITTAVFIVLLVSIALSTL